MTFMQKLAKKLGLKDDASEEAILAAIGKSGDKDGAAMKAEADEAVSALVALGYRPQEASKYVLAVAAETMSCEDIIRDALRASVKN